MTRVIGLTGGIASGKSTVAALLRQAGAVVLDADQVARAVVAPNSEALTRLTKAFGEQILNPDRSLNRQQLGRLIFNDPEARRVVDEITHPLIRQVFEASLAGLKRAGVPLVVLDVPLLLEAGYQCYCDQVVVVKVDPLTQLSRLMERNHYSRREAEQRIQSQMPLAEKLIHADLVIDNDGTKEETAAQVDHLLAKWYLDDNLHSMV